MNQAWNILFASLFDKLRERAIGDITLLRYLPVANSFRHLHVIKFLKLVLGVMSCLLVLYIYMFFVKSVTEACT